MALIPIAGPSEEPVSLAEARAHLRVETTDDDLLIASLITAARVHIEVTRGHATVNQDWRLALDGWPDDGIVVLPVAPLGAVTAIRTVDAEGIPEVLASDDYQVDAASIPPRIAVGHSGRTTSSLRRLGAIEIDFTAGYGPVGSDTPQPLRQAILLLVAHWYERREPVEVGGSVDGVPVTVDALLAPYRMVRL